MKKNIVLLLFVCAIVMVQSCTRNIKTLNFTDDSIKSSHSIENGNSLGVEDSLVSPKKMFFHPQGYLIFYDYRSDELIKILNLSTHKVQKLILRGRGPKECTFISNISIVDNDIWIHGVRLNKMIRLELDKAKGLFSVVEEFKIGTQAVKVIALTDKLFAAMLCTKDRITYLDRDGNTVSKAGQFPLGFSEWAERDTLPNITFQSNIVGSPDGKYVAIANLSIDALEVYSSSGDTVCLLRGPEGLEVDMTLTNRGMGISRSLNPLYLAFGGVKGLKNEFWASYEGVDLRKDGDRQPNTIYCFSWNGKPKRKLKLDTRFQDFAVDEKAEKLYLLVNDPDLKIIEYDISSI